MRSYVRLVCIVAWVVLAGLLPAVARAEFRSWKAASGGFTTEAEFVELREGGLVRLRLRDGTLKDIPVDKLSSADQDYLSKRGAKRAGAKGDRVAKLEKETDRVHTAEEALRRYRVFQADPQTTDAERQAIAPRMEELSKLAAAKMVRLGTKWGTEDEFRQRRNKANNLMKAGLELLRLKQEDAFRTRFAEAAKVEPESIRADFMIGMVYSMFSSNYTKSKQYFETCAKREPDNVSVLNNLALASMRRGDMLVAMANWNKAARLGPNQSIVQNLGRLMVQAGKRKLNVPKGVLEDAGELYTKLTVDGRFERTDSKRGWMWMFIDEDSMSLARQDDPKKAIESPAPKPLEDGSAVIGGGSGFVVFPQYILTNNHVVENGTSFDIQTSEGSKDNLLRATLVARSEKPDLAILRCEGLKAAPVAIDPKPLGRGTDIMTLGYPEMFALGASLKATRGVISAVPSAAVEDMYLYDAVINHGNSGGPVCDQHGNVVAVTTIMTRTEGKYGGGIPAAAALAFVQQHVPGFQAPAVSQEQLDWPTVDQRVSPATVLVWTRSKEAGSSSPLVSAGYYEDRDCLPCNGLGVLKCNGEGCNGGKVLVRRGTIVVSDNCPTCGGRTIMPCPICGGTGIDPDLQRPESGAPTAPPPGGIAGPNNVPGAGPNAPVPGATGVAPGAPGAVPGAPEAAPGVPGAPGAPGVAGMIPTRPGRFPRPVRRGTSTTIRADGAMVTTVTNPDGTTTTTVSEVIPDDPTKPPTPPPDISAQPSSGNFGDLKDERLEDSVASSIRTAIESGKTVNTPTRGRGAQAFQDMRKSGGVLIGVYLSYGTHLGQSAVVALRPIYLSKTGKENGDWHGTRAGESRYIVAKPGYAVGALRIRAGFEIDAVGIVFMRRQGDRLDPTDSYDSILYGGSGGAGPTVLGGDGSLIVGIHGKMDIDRSKKNNEGGNLTELGLTVLPAEKPSEKSAEKPAEK